MSVVGYADTGVSLSCGTGASASASKGNAAAPSSPAPPSWPVAAAIGGTIGPKPTLSVEATVNGSSSSWKPPLLMSSPAQQKRGLEPLGLSTFLAGSPQQQQQQQLAQKVPARLLAELREAQGASEMEARLLAGLTDLFEELARDEYRRRAAWEEQADRSQRELRASIDADLARAACESRKLLAEAKRDAADCKKLAQPCHEFFGAMERGETPASLVQLVQREVQKITNAECERIKQQLRNDVAEIVGMASRDQERQLAQMFESERLSLKLTKQQTLSREEIRSATDEVENRLAVRLHDLKEAHTTLQAVLDKYADRWERAWQEEADARSKGDSEMNKRMEIVMRASEAQHRSLESSIRRVGAEAQRHATSTERSTQELRAHVQQAAELESRVRTDGDNELQLCLQAAEAELRALRGELQQESSTRAHTHTQLATGFEQLKSIVEQLLKIIGHDATLDSARGTSTSCIVSTPSTGAFAGAYELKPPPARSSPPTSPPNFGRTNFDALASAAAEVVMQTVANATGVSHDSPELAARAAASVPLPVVALPSSSPGSVNKPLLAVVETAQTMPASSVFPTSASSSPVIAPRLIAP